MKNSPKLKISILKVATTYADDTTSGTSAKTIEETKKRMEQDWQPCSKVPVDLFKTKLLNHKQQSTKINMTHICGTVPIFLSLQTKCCILIGLNALIAIPQP